MRPDPQPDLACAPVRLSQPSAPRVLRCWPGIQCGFRRRPSARLLAPAKSDYGKALTVSKDARGSLIAGIPFLFLRDRVRCCKNDKN